MDKNPSAIAHFSIFYWSMFFKLYLIQNLDYFWYYVNILCTHPFRETLKARLSYPCVLYWQWRRWNENQCSVINILGKETPWGWIFLSLFFKICFFWKSTFRFTGKLRERYRSFLYTRCPSHAQFPHYQHPSSEWCICYYLDRSESPKVHRLLKGSLLVSWGLGQMYKDMYPPL